MNIPSYAVSCYALKAGKITDPYFSVQVPVLGLSADIEDSTVEIIAKNCTDYRIRHDGNIKMEATKYKITKSVLEADPPGVPAHAHQSKEPFEGSTVTYSELNDVDVAVGDLMIGLFLDGSADNLVIIHIPHKVPIGGDVRFD